MGTPHFLSMGLLLALLAGCGGGASGPGPSDLPASPAEANRFLTQATFGPSNASLQNVSVQGYSGWLAGQMGQPVSASFAQYMLARQAAFNAANVGKTTGLYGLGPNQLYELFYAQAATAPDEVRQRVAFALSQIFVVSMQDTMVAGHILSAGAYYDVLQADCFGSYRQLLEDVTLAPAMGLYLSTMHNVKENAATGLHPDENYAREVMQLMSIGLYLLNPDGSVQTDGSGNPLPTYTYTDISGLAKVFTGWGWYAPTPSSATYWNGVGTASLTNPMSFYPQYHSTSAKTFLGVTIPASGTADTAGDLKIALDTLAAHPNVGPFLGTRLIQQLVTSNPSPAYVARVAAAFADNGHGVRGDLGAVVMAVLTDPEARGLADAQAPGYGKLREPVLRFANWMRAFGASSSSGFWELGALDSPANQLGQSPLNAGSVFNFWRPGYVPPGTALAANNLVAPEFQAVNEVSVAGYLNFLQGVIPNGLGGGAGALPPTTGNDITAAYATELSLASDPDALATRMSDALLYSSMSSSLHQQIVTAVSGVAVPTGTGAAKALQERVWLAVYMTMASPEYLIQR
jgi:uncharacterized protein (DUF1800 family)